MSKHSVTDKTSVIDHYIASPSLKEHKPVLRAIKSDVIKANTSKVKKASEIDNKLYSTCMGLYRQFLKDRGSHLKLDGRKAIMYKSSMTNIIVYLRSMNKSNKKPYGDDHMIKALEFIFKHWDRLKKFHQDKLGLPDIYKNIEEIIPQIKQKPKTKSNERINATSGQRFGEL